MESTVSGFPRGVIEPNHPGLKTIFHLGYEANSISPDCALAFWDQVKVITSYEKLSLTEKVAMLVSKFQFTNFLQITNFIDYARFSLNMSTNRVHVYKV